MIVTAPMFRPIRDGSPEPVDIVIIQPAECPDAGGVAEVAETLQYGLRALGYDANIQPNVVRFGVALILLCAHLLPPDETLRLPVGTIIYNLEQIHSGAWATTFAYLRLLRRHTVWDMDAANAAAIRRATGHPDVHHVPIGYAPPLTRILPASEADIDVLFYGSVTPRRGAVLQALSAAGLNVKAVFRVYGSERDALIARARIVLNMHAHDDARFEIVRVSYLLANRKAVVCEAASPTDIEADLRDAVCGVPYDRLVDACRELMRDEETRHRLEEVGFATFSRRDEAAILRRVLTAPVPPPAPFVLMATDDAAMLRNRYLELLARSLTNQIYRDPPFDDGSLGRFDSQTRSLGRDWPSQAMTMVGDANLANIRQLFEMILAARVPGDLMEAGAGRGGACIFMRGLLEAFGIRDRRVWVADSFAGMPPPDPHHVHDRGDIGHTLTRLAVDLETVRENFAMFDLLDAQVGFLPGWFAETLQAAPIQRLALLRVDAYMYGSTMDCLTALYHKVSPGGFVVVGEYGPLPACAAAVTDFRAAHNIITPIHDIQHLGAFWQVPP